MSNPSDICDGEDVEFFIESNLTHELLEKSCSAGNFLWKATKVLYSEEEIVNKNYCGTKGKKGFTPRRKHTIKHLYMKNYDSNKDNFMKAITAINMGINGLSKKRKRDNE